MRHTCPDVPGRPPRRLGAVAQPPGAGQSKDKGFPCVRDTGLSPKGTYGGPHPAGHVLSHGADSQPGPGAQLKPLPSSHGPSLGFWEDAFAL